MGAYEKMEKYYKAMGYPISFPLFVTIIFLVAASTAAVSFLLLNPVTAAVVFIAISTLIIGIPLRKRDKRIEEIETNLPDALKHMAAILRAGGTIEGALSEVSRSDYGPLSADLGNGLKELREGKTFEEVLLEAGHNSGSKFFERIAVIVIDAKKAGAGLAAVMDAIAVDAKSLERIKRERISRTTMPVVFLYVASLLLAPFIFGFVISIVKFIGAGMSTALKTTVDFSFLANMLTFFLAFEAAISMVAIGIIKSGKIMRYVLWIPIAIVVALIVFQGGQFLGHSIAG